MRGLMWAATARAFWAAFFLSGSPAPGVLFRFSTKASVLR